VWQLLGQLKCLGQYVLGGASASYGTTAFHAVAFALSLDQGDGVIVIVIGGAVAGRAAATVVATCRHAGCAAVAVVSLASRSSSHSCPFLLHVICALEKVLDLLAEIGG